MKTRLIILSLLISACAACAGEKSPLDSLLFRLDNLIQNSAVYSDIKENRINELKKRLIRTENASAESYELNRMLFEEYRSYICDSAIQYINRCIEIAEALHADERKYDSQLKQSHLMGTTGMYKEGIDILESIDRAKLPASLLIDYYTAYECVYGELGYYTQDRKKGAYYSAIARAYRDSLRNALPENSEKRRFLDANSFLYRQRFDEAVALNQELLAGKAQGTPEHAMYAYQRAMICMQQGNNGDAKFWFANSSISDIEATIKDHASLWMLAQILYQEEDIERSYNYIRFSWSETVFYNARLRSLQTASILSLIDNTYQKKMDMKNRKLRNNLILISILLVILAGSFILIYRQMKKLSLARKNLQEANSQLQNLNEELKSVNKLLQDSNANLLESNQIKEEYIGRFLKLCSTYIEKMNEYRRLVNKKIKNGQIDELLRTNLSQDALDAEREELYAYFDDAFLRFYPDFVGRVNSLLRDDGRIVLKEGELLNTELRILALIRLGINDSLQIADFLRYSLNTIYNYRAKMKNRASGPRDDFENQVKKIHWY